MNNNNFIGKKVEKISGKPFKSGNKINTVKGIGINPNTGKECFLFNEDESLVDIRICKIKEDD